MCFLDRGEEGWRRRKGWLGRARYEAGWDGIGSNEPREGKGVGSKIQEKVMAECPE